MRSHGASLPDGWPDRQRNSAAEDIATKNARCTRESGGIEVGRHGWGLGGIKPEQAMRVCPVVVGNVLGEHLSEMAAALNEQVV